MTCVNDNDDDAAAAATAAAAADTDFINNVAKTQANTGAVRGGHY